jgi:hypothetical protein
VLADTATRAATCTPGAACPCGGTPAGGTLSGSAGDAAVRHSAAGTATYTQVSAAGADSRASAASTAALRRAVLPVDDTTRSFQRTLEQELLKSTPFEIIRGKAKLVRQGCTQFQRVRHAWILLVVHLDLGCLYLGSWPGLMLAQHSSAGSHSHALCILIFAKKGILGPSCAQWQHHVQLWHVASWHRWPLSAAVCAASGGLLQCSIPLSTRTNAVH